MLNQRFWPGPQGIEAAVVVPMTDYSLKDVDGHALTNDALRKLMEETALLRGAARRHNFAQGNKVACLLDIDKAGGDEDVTPLRLHHGPFGKHFNATLDFPGTPALGEKKPQTVKEFLQIIADPLMGGNISNMVRSKAALALAGIGAQEMRIFSPEDDFFTPWLQELQEKIGNTADINLTLLKKLKSRFGVGFPYDDDDGRRQLFSINTPQDSTLEAMRQHAVDLHGCKYVAVSEGLGQILKSAKVNVGQLFNPTSALHVESAIEALHRSESQGMQDIIIVNEDEWELWIKIMENRRTGVDIKQLPDAKFPSPFQKDDKSKIDPVSVNMSNASHLRILQMLNPPRTDYISSRIAVGCGPKGAQYLFQWEDKNYIGVTDTPSDIGAERLIKILGQQNKVSTSIRDVIGAGDAATVAATMGMLYAPLEDIIAKRDSGLSKERLKIAAIAFNCFLGRVFGELCYRSRERDLTGVPTDAFPRLFDMVLDKSIKAAHTITLIPKMPSAVHTDDEWDMHFTAWELQE